MLAAIDIRPLGNQSASRGIGMYTGHLIRYLKKIPGLEVAEIKEGELPEKTDVVHYPWFDLYFRTLPMRRKRPTVVTVHDVIPLVLKEFYSKKKINLEASLKVQISPQASAGLFSLNSKRQC